MSYIQIKTNKGLLINNKFWSRKVQVLCYSSMKNKSTERKLELLKLLLKKVFDKIFFSKNSWKRYKYHCTYLCKVIMFQVYTSLHNKFTNYNSSLYFKMFVSFFSLENNNVFIKKNILSNYVFHRLKKKTIRKRSPIFFPKKIFWEVHISENYLSNTKKRYIFYITRYFRIRPIRWQREYNFFPNKTTQICTWFRELFHLLVVSLAIYHFKCTPFFNEEWRMHWHSEQNLFQKQQYFLLYFI